MILASYSPDQYSAFWSGVGALATLGAAIVAAWTLVALRSDSRDRTRPVMSAHLEHAVLSDIAMDLIVTNLGQSVAKEVQVIFDPPLPTEGGDVTPFLRRRYAQPIQTLAPGRQLRNVYFVARDDGSGKKTNSEPVSDDFTVTFEYKDSRGRNYSDPYLLSVGTLLLESSANPSNTDERGMERRRLRALEAIARGVGRH